MCLINQLHRISFSQIVVFDTVSGAIIVRRVPLLDRQVLEIIVFQGLGIGCHFSNVECHPIFFGLHSFGKMNIPALLTVRSS